LQTVPLSSKIPSVNTTVPDFLLNAAAYLHRVMEGEQVCLVKEGRSMRSPRCSAVAAWARCIKGTADRAGPPVAIKILSNRPG
jgi:hypothetical protein